MTELLTVSDLRVDLPMAGGLAALLPGRNRHINILSGVSLSIACRETLGLVGESGSGKTTLGRALMGLVPITAGEVRFNGERLAGRHSFAILRRQAAMMFQDPVASLSPRLRVSSAITEPYRIAGRPVGKDQAVRLLAQVGLPPDIGTRYPHQLSGGQARRVGVARALALEPKFIIADEPTAGLDVSVQGEVLNLLADLKARLGLSFLMITHNLAMVRHAADRIAVMYLGRLVEVGPARQVFGAALHPYTQSLIAAEPRPDPRRRRADLAIKGEIPSILNRPAGCAFSTRCPRAAARCRTEEPELQDFGSGHAARCHFAGP